MNMLKAVIFLSLTSVVFSINDTANIEKLENYCIEVSSNENRKSVLAPKIYNSRSIYSFTNKKFFLCHSTSPTLLQFTSNHYNYTQFYDVWKTMKAYKVSCGIGVIFETITCQQHLQKYQCSLKLNNGTQLNSSTATTRDLSSLPSIYGFSYDLSDSKVLPNKTVKLTCLAPPKSTIYFKFKGVNGDEVVIKNSTVGKYDLRDPMIVEYDDISRTLTLEHYSYDNDDGKYSCVTSVVGCRKVAEKSLNISGYLGPVISSFTSSSPILYGKEVNLTCTYYSTASMDHPHVHFRKANDSNHTYISLNEIQGKYQYHQPIFLQNKRVYERTLSIFDFQPSDNGEYMCSIILDQQTEDATYNVIAEATQASTDPDGFTSYYIIAILAAVFLFSFVIVIFLVRVKKKRLERNGNTTSRTQVLSNEFPLTDVNADNQHRIAFERHLGDSTTRDETIDHHYDVFICYSSLDREWVKNTLLKELESRGIKAYIDYRDFLVGAYIVENIADAIYGSRKTIAVLSPDFMDSVYCKHELQTALSRMANHQVIPVLYRSCEVPDVLKDKTYLDWCHTDVQPYFWELLVKAILT